MCNNMDDKDITRARVISMCRQAGKLLKELSHSLPSRVVEMVEQFPYSSSLICAVGMEEYYSYRTNPRAGIYRDSEILQGGFCEKIELGLHELITMGASEIEALPSIDLLYTLYAAESQVCFHIGLAYEYEVIHKEKGIIERRIDDIHHWYSPLRIRWNDPNPFFLRERIDEAKRILGFFEAQGIKPHPIFEEEIRILNTVRDSICDEDMGLRRLDIFRLTKRMRAVEENGVTRVKSFIRFSDKPYAEDLGFVKLSVFSPVDRPDVLMVQKDGYWGPFIKEKNKLSSNVELIPGPFRYDSFSLVKGTDQFGFFRASPENIAVAYMLVEQKGKWGVLEFSRGANGDIKASEIVPCRFFWPSNALRKINDSEIESYMSQVSEHEEYDFVP